MITAAAQRWLSPISYTFQASSVARKASTASPVATASLRVSVILCLLSVQATLRRTAGSRIRGCRQPRA